jgi:hypothetical protein
VVALYATDIPSPWAVNCVFISVTRELAVYMPGSMVTVRTVPDPTRYMNVFRSLVIVGSVKGILASTSSSPTIFVNVVPNSTR